jgi:hypothetical protein
LESSLAAPLFLQIHSDGLFERPWDGKRYAAMNRQGSIEAVLERIEDINIDPPLHGHYDGQVVISARTVHFS